MSGSRKRGPDRKVRLVEFRGKYQIVTPAELSERWDEELVELIMKREKMDESRALEALGNLRREPLGGVAYDRV